MQGISGFAFSMVAMAIWGRKSGKGFFQVTDFIAPLVPLGLMAGRIGNFINGELWGRVADPALPWAMVYPQVDSLPRHPSPLYQAAGEGLLLFAILWIFSSRQRATGQVSGMLSQAAEYYENDVEEGTKDLSTIIEPMLMLLIGAFVGVFAVSMISPIYSLSSQI